LENDDPEYFADFHCWNFIKKNGEKKLALTDLFRCQAVFSDIDAMTAALQAFNSKYTVVRIKNKMDSSLSQVVLNFYYDDVRKYDYEAKNGTYRFVAEA